MMSRKFCREAAQGRKRQRQSWSAPTHPGPAFPHSRSIEMEITCYFQCQHPSCSPHGARLGPPLLALAPCGSCHSVSQTCTLGNRDVVGLKNAMGSRVSPLILSGHYKTCNKQKQSGLD